MVQPGETSGRFTSERILFAPEVLDSIDSEYLRACVFQTGFGLATRQLAEIAVLDVVLKHRCTGGT